MQKAGFLFLFLFGWVATLKAQEAPRPFWVFLRDKGPDIAQRLSQPQQYMKAPALARRLADGIPLDSRDLPVYSVYADQVAATGVRCYYASRWLNAVMVTATAAQVQALYQLPCVARIEAEPPMSFTAPAATGQTTSLDYGQAAGQIQQIGLDYLHDRGYRGQGVKVAVFDSGFPNVNTQAAFSDLMNGRFMLGYDFVDNNDNIFGDDSHGTNCLSILTAYIANQYRGGADQAQYYLARTETTALEGYVEQRNWLAAAEWADQQGVQIISSSLVYNFGFTTGDANYTYADMDGNTTIITRAADAAASRGILVVNSAGNEGAGNWKKLAAPCDGDSVLCVGAVNSQGIIMRFSSQGPSSDGRIKPNVVAQGGSTNLVQPGGAIIQADGTSFASPLVASLAVCLKQAHPNASNMQLLTAIEQSANRAQNPDTLYGYGIPNARRADSILAQVTGMGQGPQIQQPELQVGPNPNNGSVQVLLKLSDYRTFSLDLLDGLGRVVWSQHELISNAQLPIDLGNLPSGQYTLRATLPNGQSIGTILMLLP